MDNLDFGRFRLVPSERLLLREGTPVPLREKVFDTLRVLVESRGRLVTKKELMDAVWPETHVEESNLIHNISILRKTLGDQYIETVPKHGYRFITPQDARRDRRRLAFIAALAIALSVSCYFVLKMAQEASAAQIRSIAILPLRNRGSSGYIGFGIADSLITRLSGMQGIRVRSISSVSRYADASRDPIAAGKALAVDAVLDGELQQSGDAIRASLQLISIPDGVSIWSATFDGDSRNVFRLEDTISSAFVQIPILALQPAAPSHSGTARPEAFEAYLKGRFFWNRRTLSDFRTAIGFFRQAIDRDPNYALAWAGLADAYNMYGGDGANGRNAAMRALALDSSLAAAHAAIANVYLFQDWNFPAAERELRRAIDLDPNYATAHQWYAFDLAARGNMTAALAEIRAARICDPGSLIINTDLGQILYYARRFGEAIAAFQAAQKLDADFAQAHQALGECYEQLGRYEDAAQELSKAGRFGARGSEVTQAARAGANAYWRARAETIAPELRTFYRQAESSLRLGRRDEALEMLQKALEHREAEFVMINVEPACDPLRKDPEFQQLASKLQMPH